MEQKEKEQKLKNDVCDFANSKFIISDSTRDLIFDFAKSEATKAYHQQKRFVRTENGTTLLELVFRKVDEHIKLENKNGWWDEYKGLMLRAEQENQQTESVNLDELRNEYLEASDKIVPWAPGNHYYEGKNRGFRQGCDWLLNRLSSYLQPQEQKQSDVVKIQQSNEALEQVLKMMETENMHKSPLYSQVKLTIEKNKSL